MRSDICYAVGDERSMDDALEAKGIYQYQLRHADLNCKLCLLDDNNHTINDWKELSIGEYIETYNYNPENNCLVSYFCCQNSTLTIGEARRPNLWWGLLVYEERSPTDCDLLGCNVREIGCTPPNGPCDYTGRVVSFQWNIYTWTLLMCGICGVVVWFFCAWSYKVRRTRENPIVASLEIVYTHTPRTSESSPETRIANMTVEERIVLYNDAFDQNKNQTTLTTTSTRPSNSGDSTSAREGHSDLGSFFRGLLGHAPDSENNDSGKITRDELGVKSTIVHPRSVDVETNGVQETNGTCAICLDDLKAGEKVVWSEHESCPHVYHKVSYNILGCFFVLPLPKL